MSSQISDGGKKILDVQARNEAIELMKLKSYLRLDEHRPRWAKVADALINHNISKSQNIWDDNSTMNTFLQTWAPAIRKGSKLPGCIKEMIKTAKKYHVDLNPPLPCTTLHRNMPIWFHKGQDQEKHPQNNGKWAKCQRNNHEILTVHELDTYVNETQDLRHFPRSNCSCLPCKAAQNKGCEHPIKCRKAAQKLLDALHPKWKPTGAEAVDGLGLNDDELRQNAQARISGNPQIFNQNIMSSPSLTDEFRVFTKPAQTQATVATRTIHDQQQNINEEEITVSICGVHVNAGYEEAASAYTIWYGDNDPRNATHRTKGALQTKETSEYQALLQTLLQTPNQAKLHINVTLPYIRDMLTSNLSKNEDKGWIGVPNGEILQTIVATLRARTGRTLISKILDQEIRSKTKDLAKTGLTLDIPDMELNLEPPASFLVTGIRLSQATQSILYKGILKQKIPPARAASTLNLGITRACVEELTTKSPTDQKIWTSLRSKDFPPPNPSLLLENYAQRI